MEGFFVVQRAAKLHPGGALKKTWQLALFGPFAPRQDDGQHAQLLVRGVDPPLEGQAHFLIVPGAQPVRAKKDHAGSALAQGLFEGRLPGLAGNQVPLVEPAGDSLLFQLLGHLLDQGLVGAVMRQKRVIRRPRFRLYTKTRVCSTHKPARLRPRPCGT
jgi:hypothetical protein